MKTSFALLVVLLLASPLSQPEAHAGAHAGFRAEHQQARWPNGRLRLDTTVVDDAYHGEYRTWYQSGAPYELRHFVHGREEGVQQSWTETGQLYLNYEVRHGRRYGFINATPCLPVEKEKP